MNRLEESEVIKQLKVLQYHQSLIVTMLTKSQDEFYKLVIQKGLTEDDVQKFHSKCVHLSIQLEEQKAEGFVYFHPLYLQFLDSLPSNLTAKEVILACISQNLYLTLMTELKNYL
ncbi:DUF1878 family protein [Bacillus sp. CGMCC 1.16607]|uniref:DUF1878 family protein n=1 Tax=Bacillus sp. CGMCC 1.16607 TaxID=3351842 RepID=UPI00363592D3